MIEVGGTRMGNVLETRGRTQPMIRGSCLCGAVQYDINGDVELMEGSWQTGAVFYNRQATERLL